MKNNLKTFPKLPYRRDSIHLGSKAQFLSYIAKTIKWKEDFEEELKEILKEEKLEEDEDILIGIKEILKE